MTQAILLAAGRGTRMNSKDMNKCLFPLNGKPMIRYPLEALKELGIKKPIVVVGFAKESVISELGEEVVYAEQKEPTGTATAFQAGFEALDPDVEEVIGLYGDHSAFYDTSVLMKLISIHRSTDADMTMVTVVVSDPTGYGRIVRDTKQNLVEIVEEKNATPKQREIKEINSGNAIYKASFLREFLTKIKQNELTKEYYLPDLVKLGLDAGKRIETMISYDEGLSMGVNTPSQLATAEAYMKSKS
jgi:bifunctional UDP-N-acetylglucosamine pyrophosphorylase/glucosamine-1-phosphate N-acetyltransferase